MVGPTGVADTRQRPLGRSDAGPRRPGARSHRPRSTGAYRVAGALAVAAVALAITAAGCGSTTDTGTAPDSTAPASRSAPGPGTTSPKRPGGTTSSRPAAGGWTPTQLGPATVAIPSGPVDQTPPRGTNGLAWDGRRLWVADLAGHQILAVDPRTGTIEARFGPDQGVSGPDDLAVGPDGAVYWTGFDDGTIGRLGPDGTSTAIAHIGAGANGIAFAPDGMLYVSRAVTADGLFRIDPTGTTPPIEVSPSIGNVNAFAFGPDGAIYGPSYRDQKGALVRIDPDTGAVTEVLGNLGFVSAVKFGPDEYAYVLTSLPVGVLRVDLATGRSEPYTAPTTKAVDNLAYDGDGFFAVSAFNEPVLSILPPAPGAASTVRLGRG